MNPSSLLSELTICLDALSDPRIVAFLSDHLRDMYSHTPAESVHALDVFALRQPEVTFWSAWRGEEVVGCAALKRLDAEHAELKSMRTAPIHRGQGIAALLLEHVIENARQRGYRRLSLETGASAHYAPARHLYLKRGFSLREPFADYTDDPNSVYMTLVL